MGLAPSGDYACCLTVQALEGIGNVIKSVDDALCEDKGYGPYKLVATVEEVLRAFRKYGIIASSKKLIIGNSVEFGDAVICGSSEGVTIAQNMSRISAIRDMRGH